MAVFHAATLKIQREEEMFLRKAWQAFIVQFRRDFTVDDTIEFMEEAALFDREDELKARIFEKFTEAFTRGLEKFYGKVQDVYGRAVERARKGAVRASPPEAPPVPAREDVFSRTNFQRRSLIAQKMREHVNAHAAPMEMRRIKDMIRQTVGTNLSKRELATLYRQSFGLTRIQFQWVLNFERELREGRFTRAMNRQLFPRQFTGHIAGLPPDGQLPARTIRRMRQAYYANMVGMRARTVAQTETTHWMNRGFRDMMDASYESGAVPPDQVTERWYTMVDPAVRDSHWPMEGQAKGSAMDGGFVSGAGNFLRWPGDFIAPAEEVCNCRCRLGVEYMSVDTEIEM